MALRDLVIRPKTQALQYASGMFDELRLRFADIQERKDVSQAICDMAARGRGRCISAKATMDNSLDEKTAMTRPSPPVVG